jgi:hypothetical protein
MHEIEREKDVCLSHSTISYLMAERVHQTIRQLEQHLGRRMDAAVVQE